MERTSTVEWNVAWINADDVWTQFGVTGAGAVVGDLDTGVQWDHPALKPNYRGWDGVSANHNYNWWDAISHQLVPYDDHGHGTHTTGTAIGGDGPGPFPNDIGVAPGAKWMACKNMNSGGSGSTATFTECFQFALAPTDLNGQNPRPDLAPDVVNNSWGYFGGNPVFYSIIQNLRNAGIFVEVSAGNEGPGCATLRSPGDYNNVFTTGATDYRTEIIADYSSRGPSYLYPSIIKPDVVAPGSNINSSLPGNTYSTRSGTSMAGPHVTGLVALIISANPSPRGQVAQIENIIRNTAFPTSVTACNTSGVPNNVYGWGRIDALAAVRAVRAVILYDQYNNASTIGASSQNFEPALDQYDDELADDFVVPAGDLWFISGVDVDGVYFNGTGPADSVNVRFYANSGANLPGTLLAERLNQPYTGTAGDFSITFTQMVTLGPGTYWVSVQANQNFTPNGQWGWIDRTVRSNNPAAWRNPGGGFGVCLDWGYRVLTCGIDPANPDQVFRIRGTSGQPTATPTPTPTRTRTPTPTPTRTPTPPPGPSPTRTSTPTPALYLPLILRNP